MRGLKQSLMIATIVIPTMAIAADTVTMTAGRWEETITVTRATVNDVLIPSSALGESGKNTYSCLSADEAADPVKYFLSREEGDQCIPTGSVADGRVAAEAACTGSDKKPFKVRVAGTYGARTYAISANSDLASDVGNIKIELNITGRHVGACRGDEE